MSLPAVAGVDSKSPLSASMCKCTVKLNFSEDMLKQMSEKTCAPVDLSAVKIGGNTYYCYQENLCWICSCHLLQG